MSTISNPSKAEEVRKELPRLLSEARSPDQLMENITRLLFDKMLKYNWVGFYMLEPGVDPPVLVLGHFQGVMIPHKRIPLNQGICGAAASSAKTVIIDDVGSDRRYLACAVENKLYIVGPVFADG